MRAICRTDRSAGVSPIPYLVPGGTREYSANPISANPPAPEASTLGYLCSMGRRRARHCHTSDLIGVCDPASNRTAVAELPRLRPKTACVHR